MRHRANEIKTLEQVAALIAIAVIDARYSVLPVGAWEKVTHERQRCANYCAQKESESLRGNLTHKSEISSSPDYKNNSNESEEKQSESRSSHRVNDNRAV